MGKDIARALPTARQGLAIQHALSNLFEKGTFFPQGLQGRVCKTFAFSRQDTTGAGPAVGLDYKIMPSLKAGGFAEGIVEARILRVPKHLGNRNRALAS
jgi:hypothetical protein